MTNADKIRAMTDEELLQMFGRSSICGSIPVTFCHKQTNCEQCLLEWLKQEVSDGSPKD